MLGCIPVCLLSTFGNFTRCFCFEQIVITGHRCVMGLHNEFVFLNVD